MLNIDFLRSAIEGNGFISKVYYLDELDSTNSFASKREIPSDSLIITSYQTAGKGRLNRKWESEKNMNLTFSIKKYLPLSPAENHFAVCYFSYYVFAAICDELKKCGVLFPDNDLYIKWPNDIMYGKMKLSGILIESKLPSNEFVIGIGVNCNQRTFPEGINAVSLSEITGKKIDMNRLLLGMLNNFSVNFTEILSSNFNIIFGKWKNSTNIIGKLCSLDTGNGHVSNGKIIDLNFDGSITIQEESGLTKYFSGDMRIVNFL